MASKKKRSTAKQAGPSKSAGPAPASQTRAIRLRAAIIVLAGVIAYSNSFSGPFILDDQGAIVENGQIRQWWPLTSVLFPAANSSVAGRPLVNLSFAVNYALGDLSVRGYHVWNLAAHLVCALLIFGVVRRVLDLPRVRVRAPASSVNLAFAVALLWTVHPLNSEVVDYLSQRSESMMAAFYLLVLYTAIRAIGANKTTWEWLAVVSCGLGMTCKESMITAPVVVALFDRVYVFDSWRQAWRARRWLYLGLAATWLVLAGLVRSGPRGEVVGFSSGVTAWTYLLNQASIIVHYWRLALWPKGLVVFYGWPIPLTLSDVMPAALLIVLLAAVTMVALIRVPMFGFLGAWVFVTLAPTSSIVPISTEVGAERRMYLPLVGLIALVVIGASTMWAVARRRWGGIAILHAKTAPTAGVFVLTAAAVALAMGSIARNREYASAMTLARTVVDRRPTGVAHHILAEQLAHAGRSDEAVMHLREAVARGDSKASYALGIELFNQGQLDAAVEQFRLFVATWNLPYRLVPHWLEPAPTEVVTARLGMARAFSTLHRGREAVEQAELVLKIAPSNADAHGLIADVLFVDERFEEARVRYREYLQLRPNDVRALINLGVTLVARGQLEEAIAQFRRAVGADPHDARARRVLVTALLDRGNVEEAAVQARDAVAALPDDRDLRVSLDQLLAESRGQARARHAGP